jgi:hypothetical protein
MWKNETKSNSLKCSSEKGGGLSKEIVENYSSKEGIL